MAYPAMLGEVVVGDRVLLNTTAVELGLGTGGYHFVMAVEGRDRLDPPAAGRTMKLRYTPEQVRVLSVEEPDSPHAADLRSAQGLSGTPVVWAPLHSMVGPIAAGAVAAGARAGRLRDDRPRCAPRRPVAPVGRPPPRGAPGLRGHVGPGIRRGPRGGDGVHRAAGRARGGRGGRPGGRRRPGEHRDGHRVGHHGPRLGHVPERRRHPRRAAGRRAPGELRRCSAAAPGGVPPQPDGPRTRGAVAGARGGAGSGRSGSTRRGVERPSGPAAGGAPPAGRGRRRPGARPPPGARGARSHRWVVRSTRIRPSSWRPARPGSWPGGWRPATVPGARVRRALRRNGPSSDGPLSPGPATPRGSRSSPAGGWPPCTAGRPRESAGRWRPR